MQTILRLYYNKEFAPIYSMEGYNLRVLESEYLRDKTHETC